MNWGKGIVIVIVAFIAFIMYFVIRMNTDNKFDHDLVTEEYYKKELNYQQEIDASKNAKNLGEDISVVKTENGLTIYFPTSFHNEIIEGKVFLYRPSNKQLDFEIPISLSDSTLLVPDKRLLDGRWNITVSLVKNKKNYLFKKEITY